MLRAISQSVTISVEQCPFVEFLALTDVVTDRSEVVPEQFLDTHALSIKDWRKAQRDDPTLKCIIDQLESGSRVSVPQTQTILLLTVDISRIGSASIYLKVYSIVRPHSMSKSFSS